MSHACRGTILLLGLLGLLAGYAHAAGPQPSDECWKASFREQLSGEVREKSTSGSPYGYTYSYEGDFRWVGEPKATPVSQDYVVCFRKRLDDGGSPDQSPW